MLGLGAESILHGLICATGLVVLQRWRRKNDPDPRLGSVLLAMLLPTLLTPMLRLLVPLRLTPAFRDGPALFSGSHFGVWQTATVVVLGALAVLGVLLFLRDLVPLVRDLMHSQPEQKARDGVAAQAVAKTAQRMGVPVPAVMEVAHTGPVLMCRGWHPRLVISAALVQALSPEELEAAITHELAHAARHDPRLGWGLMLMRTLCFWNPAVQLLGRRAVREIERRADQTAVRVLGDAGPLVSAVRRIAAIQTSAAPWLRLTRPGLEARCQAVKLGPAPSRQSWPLVFALGLAIILFLVVV